MYNFARDLISRTFVTRKVLRISSRNLCPSSTTITIYHTPTKKNPKRNRQFVQLTSWRAPNRQFGGFGDFRIMFL